jgi:fructokinase
MTPRKTIVALGEILWDIFPDGAHFGGAPANFACSAAELGVDSTDVFIIGSIGHDDLGLRAIELLRGHGVDSTYVSKTAQPTGQVLVTLDAAGSPSFEIATNTAWDNIAWTNEMKTLAARADAVCFGTLGQRCDVSRHTIQQFINSTRPECLRILDINLRPPFWNEEIIRQALALANILKLNDTELKTLSDVLKCSGSESDVLRRIIDTYSLSFVALTRGGEGATLIAANGQRSNLPAPRVTVADTVGAGDAYTAAFCIGLLGGTPLEDINRWATQVAAHVCSHPGAAPHLPANLRTPR